MHCDEHLFFCTEQEDGTLNIALKSFFASKAKQDTDRYSVISFCVNQDIRTPGGKARHFFLLSLKDGKYVILHVDLLNTYTQSEKFGLLKKKMILSKKIMIRYRRYLLIVLHSTKRDFVCGRMIRNGLII